LITWEQYVERIAKMKKNIYINGEVIGRDDPRVVKGTHTFKVTFDKAQDPEYQDLVVVKSHITGKPINRWTHIHQSVEDLMNKQLITRKLCNLTGGCIQRCMGTDSMNALSVVTKDCDLKYGTNYYERWIKYLEYFQENDIVASCGQTDAKGDRSKRPGEQHDPDQYVHVVERRPDGVVVRGAKLHNTSAMVDEIIVIPTRALKENEKDWAIAFAIPADTEGVYLISKYSEFSTRAPGLESPLSEVGDVECMVVLDDVFVPNERIFINGETEFGGQLALLFALFHRHSYSGCKPGMADVMMGTAALVTDYLGIAKAPHIRERLADMVSVAEIVFACGIAAGYKARKAASGTYVPDIVFANIGRRHAGHNIYHEYGLLSEMAGGLAATLPHSKDYNSPVVGDFVRKYVSRRAGVSAENHYRAWHLAEDLLVSHTASVAHVAGLHGGGSPIMEDIAVMSAYDLESKKNLAKYLAGIKE